MTNPKPFPIFVKDNYFSKNEESLIWKGLNKIHDIGLFSPPESTESAKDREGNVLKNNQGYFINPNEELDPDIKNLYSNVLKVFNGATVEYSRLGFWESSILNTNRHGVLVSYYGDGDEYLDHFDLSSFTILMWFYKEPKRFKGGNLILRDIGEEIEVRNNRITIIPGHTVHAVPKVIVKGAPEKSGRYCISIFLNV